MIRIAGYANRAGNVDSSAHGEELRVYCCTYAFSHFLSFLQWRLWQDDQKFFASPAPDDIGRAHTLGESLTKGDKDFIACRMPITIVERLKMIHIHKEQRA